VGREVKPLSPSRIYFEYEKYLREYHPHSEEELRELTLEYAKKWRQKDIHINVSMFMEYARKRKLVDINSY